MESPRSQTSPLPTGNFPKISLQKPQYKRKANYHRRHMSTDKKNGVAHIRSLDEVTHSKAARASAALSPQQWGSMPPKPQIIATRDYNHPKWSAEGFDTTKRAITEGQESVTT
jgi:hypothetical protein